LFVFGGTGIWTCGLILARQALYHLSYSASPLHQTLYFHPSWNEAWPLASKTRKMSAEGWAALRHLFFFFLQIILTANAICHSWILTHFLSTCSFLIIYYYHN
jgi:hypothetical protein